MHALTDRVVVVSQGRTAAGFSSSPHSFNLSKAGHRETSLGRSNMCNMSGSSFLQVDQARKPLPVSMIPVRLDLDTQLLPGLNAGVELKHVHPPFQQKMTGFSQAIPKIS